MNLSKQRVAVLATDGVEESELLEPVQALRNAGATVELISDKEFVQAFRHMDKGVKVPATTSLETADPDAYTALYLPGGALNADKLRTNKLALKFVSAMDRNAKPIAMICHAPWIAISAGLVGGRKMTSYHSIEADLTNAGAEWSDESVVDDENWVTSREPEDIPDFNKHMLALFGRDAA